MSETRNGELVGKVALVTGASYGIGRAISEELGRRGAIVVLTDISDRADATASELRETGIEAVATRLDVQDIEAVNAAFDFTLKKYGRLDILVNNAAMPRSAKVLMDMDSDTWDATMQVNVRGTLLCMQAAMRAMIAQGEGGRIINIASTAAFRPYKRRGHYCTSKAAIVALSQVAALEFAEHKVTVNCVAPGQTETENLKMMVGGGLSAEEGEEMRRRQALMPLGVSQPIDIANAVANFASPASRQVTGQTLRVDGGVLLV